MLGLVVESIYNLNADKLWFTDNEKLKIVRREAFHDVKRSFRDDKVVCTMVNTFYDESAKLGIRLTTFRACPMRVVGCI